MLSFKLQIVSSKVHAVQRLCEADVPHTNCTVQVHSRYALGVSYSTLAAERFLEACTHNHGRQVMPHELQLYYYILIIIYIYYRCKGMMRAS